MGRIAKAHGIGGEVAVDVRTDDPDRRFASGTSLATDPGDRGPLTIERARWHSGRLLVSFSGVTDRSKAEALRGTLLVADSATSPPADDPDEFWDHHLVGMSAVLLDGTALGTIVEVLHPPGPAVLVINRSDGADAPGRAGSGGELLVPFVRDIVPTVDLAARRMVISPPEGLLEL